MLFYLWGRLGVFWNRLLGRPRVVVWLFCGCSKVVLGLPPSTFLPAAYSFQPTPPERWPESSGKGLDDDFQVEAFVCQVWSFSVPVQGWLRRRWRPLDSAGAL